MTAKIIRIMLCLSLALLLCASALAEDPLAQYRVTERKFDGNVICEICFSGFEVQSEEQQGRRDKRTGWLTKGAGGPPFCSIGPTTDYAEGIQGEFSIYRYSDEGDKDYWFSMDDHNTIPEESGFDAPKAKTTVQQALELLSRLGVTDVEPVYFSALGSLQGSAKCYKVVLRQTLNGLPVHWGQSVMKTQNDIIFNIADGCEAVVVYSDQDCLLNANGRFCDFMPIGPRTGTVSQAEAEAKFAQNGLTASKPEQCYFLSIDGAYATATLAWRVANTYLSALTGEWLQLGN
ncbi:MAG: hypothetical protein IKH57_03900 [Clostridia bacterium]|nr:hypothetical protein [Clostridia bacterium]